MNEDKVLKIEFNVTKRKFTNFCVDISLAMSANEKDLFFFILLQNIKDHIINPSWIAIGEH